MFIPAIAVATLAAINNASLPHRAQIDRPSTSTGPGGVVAPTYTTIASGIPCRRAIAGHSAGERTIADQVQPIVADVVVFAPGADVREHDRLTVTGTDAGGTAFTLVFDVDAVMAPLAAEAMRKVLCTAVASAPTPVGG